MYALRHDDWYQTILIDLFFSITFRHETKAIVVEIFVLLFQQLREVFSSAGSSSFLGS